MKLFTQESSNGEQDKNLARKAVREAIYQFKDGRMTKDLLKAIVEMAMAFEITRDIEKKMFRKDKHLW